MLKLARPKSLRELATEQVRHAIVTGALAPSSLHSEQSLAETLNISRTPVREALLQLEKEGLISFVPNRGVRIAPLDPVHLIAVFELRTALESYSAVRLAKQRRPECIEQLVGELEKQRQIIQQNDSLQWVIANMDFHIALVATLGNSLFDQQMPPLASHTMRIGYKIVTRRERMEEAYEEHRSIVEALSTGDAEKAENLVVSHLHITGVLMSQLFGAPEELGQQPGEFDLQRGGPCPSSEHLAQIGA